MTIFLPETYALPLARRRNPAYPVPTAGERALMIAMAHRDIRYLAGLAAAVGTTSQVLSDIMHGRRLMKRVRREIAGFLGIPLDSLMPPASPSPTEASQ